MLDGTPSQLAMASGQHPFPDAVSIPKPHNHGIDQRSRALCYHEPGGWIERVSKTRPDGSRPGGDPHREDGKVALRIHSVTSLDARRAPGRRCKHRCRIESRVPRCASCVRGPAVALGRSDEQLAGAMVPADLAGQHLVGPHVRPPPSPQSRRDELAGVALALPLAKADSRIHGFAPACDGGYAAVERLPARCGRILTTYAYMPRPTPLFS